MDRRGILKQQNLQAFDAAGIKGQYPKLALRIALGNSSSSNDGSDGSLSNRSRRTNERRGYHGWRNLDQPGANTSSSTKSKPETYALDKHDDDLSEENGLGDQDRRTRACIGRHN